MMFSEISRVWNYVYFIVKVKYVSLWKIWVYKNEIRYIWVFKWFEYIYFMFFNKLDLILKNLFYKYIT